MVLGRDKIRTKHLLAAVGLPTAEYAVVDTLPAPIWSHAWPAIVKPGNQDASVGIHQNSVVTSQSQLAERVESVLAQYGPPVLIERYIAGREFHVHMIEDAETCGTPKVLPLAEIAFDRSVKGRWDIYTFTAKWDEESDEYRTAPLKAPVEIPPEDFERIRSIAVRSYSALLCRDYARIDVRMDENKNFYILEMNPNPYLNSLALVNGLMAIGRTHEEQIVAMALAAITRGGKNIPLDNIHIPVGVVTGV
jgi:D-alanine-D-alanine ligase